MEDHLCPGVVGKADGLLQLLGDQSSGPPLPEQVHVESFSARRDNPPVLQLAEGLLHPTVPSAPIVQPDLIR
eukprot:3141922-Prorocentrum_lima.AAC.1